MSYNRKAGFHINPDGKKHMLKKREFVEFMCGAGVLTFGDFTLKSGRRAPYFVNTGNYKTGRHISLLGDYYAACITESGVEFDGLYGPAYKGITLVAAASSSLFRLYERDVPYFFNRKEQKDHGEGGTIVGYKPRDGDKIAIVEDVVSAGTAVRESLKLLQAVADVTVTALFVSVDRMERGTGELSALDELAGEYGISVYPIITARDIINSLEENDSRRTDMLIYLEKYGAAQNGDT